MSACRLCRKATANGDEWCDSCAIRLGMVKRTCPQCKQIFRVRSNRQLFCSEPCRATNWRNDHRRDAEHDDNDPDLLPAEIERRYQAHMAYLRATRKYSVDPFAQRKHAALIPDVDL